MTVIARDSHKQLDRVDDDRVIAPEISEDTKVQGRSKNKSRDLL
jgi:hypothetical protein